MIKRITVRSCERGQMTVELAIAFPVLIVVALIAVNALTFVSECAAFDRLFCESVRVQATSRGYGVSEEAAVGAVQAALASAFSAPNIEVEVHAANAGMGTRSFTATMQFSPTLFGMGLRDSILGVPLPRVSHSATYVVDPYKSGVFA